MVSLVELATFSQVGSAAEQLKIKMMVCWQRNEYGVPLQFYQLFPPDLYHSDPIIVGNLGLYSVVWIYLIRCIPSVH